MTDALPATILVVDDTEASRYVTTRTLTSAGYRVLEATNAREALEASGLQPSLMILDVNLPDTNGFDVARALREDPATAHLPILMVSASYLGDQYRVRGLEGGADAYLTHPIEPTVLLATVRALLRVRAAEAQLRKLNQDLERQVEERTARLQEMTLDLQALAYSVSHDLREPLGHIRGFSHLLERRLEEQLDEKGRRYLKVVQDASDRMNELIDALAGFTELGQQTLRLGPVPLDQLVVHVRRDLEPLTRGRQVQWNVARLPTVRGDVILLRQAFAHLLTNALKFTQHRDVARINITLDEFEEEFVFCVRDNGVGFDNRHADRVFQMFVRLTSDDEHAGQGVGLAHLRRIVTLHGGRVWAEGHPGEGAAFYFSLPRFTGSE